MAENIKITMLGASGSGKTCFMLGMYAIMRAGVCGFNFFANSDDDLTLSEAWEKMENEEGMDRYPPPNADKPVYYSFDFKYGLTNKLATFDWMDYRGGALEDRTTQADVQDLKEHLRKSQAVFLCVSGELLSTEAAGMSHYAKLKAIRATRMTQFLSEMHDEARNVPPVVIVITKYDYCHDRDKESVIEELKLLFNPLFVQNSGWLVALSPVTLGAELASNPGNGLIDPENIHLPVSFAVYSVFKRQIAAQRARIRETENEIGNLSPGPIRQWWNRNEIADKRMNLDDARVSLKQIEKNMNLLAKNLIGNVTIFYDGEEIEIDV